MTKFWTVYLIRFVSIYFILGVIISSFLYPGGNLFDPDQIGYSFSKNYLSDLGGYMSRSGEINFLSSFIFNSSMFFYAFSGIGFLFVPSLFRDNKTIYVLAIIGSMFFFIGCFFFAGVGLTPHDIYQELHGFFAKNAFRLLIPASILYVIVLFKSSVHNKYTLVTLGYLIFTISYVVYQIFIEDAMKSPDALMESVTIQKIIAIVSTISIFSLTYAFSSKLSDNFRQN
jgi:hypothetical membrane protein